MFFIYLFFSIGVLATLLAILPTMVEIIVYLHSIFANFKTAKDNKAEVKKALLDKKKELKLAKIKGETKEEQAEVVEVEPVVEEQPSIEVKVEEEKEESAPVTEPAPSVEPNVPTDEPSIPTQPAE